MTTKRVLKGPCAAVAFGSILLAAATAGGETPKEKEKPEVSKSGLGALDPVGIAPVGKFRTSSAGKAGFQKANVEIAPPKKVDLDEPLVRRMARDRPPKGGVLLTQPEVNRLLGTAAYRKRMAALANCRGHVARLRALHLAQIPVGEIHLAWSVSRTGSIFETEVEAEGVTDPDVLLCVHGRLRSWRAPPPERPYRARTVLRLPEGARAPAVVSPSTASATPGGP